MDETAVRTRRARIGSALLSALALAAIFAAVGGGIPSDSVPRSDRLASIAPHLNAALSIGALVCIGLGVRAIRAGQVRTHRFLMSLAFVQFLGFLGLYLYKIIVEGTTAFPGPDMVYMVVYLPLLGIHIVLAIICVPLLFYVISLAIAHPVTVIPGTDHPRVGRVAATLWAISFGLGLLVYALLYLVY